MQNGTIPELYTDDKKSKYSCNPNDILKSAKNFNEKLYTKEKNVQNSVGQLSKKPNLEQSPTIFEREKIIIH